MFNLKHQKIASQVAPLDREMAIFGILKTPENGFSIIIGDEDVGCACLEEAESKVNDGIKELKLACLKEWKTLSLICSAMQNCKGLNTASLDNTIFLYNVKRGFCFSLKFPELEAATGAIKSLLSLDIQEIDTDLIKEFNTTYLRIRIIHRLIIREIYKKKLIHRYSKIIKLAQSVSGPWANLDLPEEERMWSFDEDEEYFEERSKAKRKQTRYNPEYDEDGFFFKWVDWNRSPYSFDDRQDESPYPSRSLLTIP